MRIRAEVNTNIAARILRVSPRAVRRLIDSEKMKARRNGPRGLFRINYGSVVQRMLAMNREEKGK